MATTAVVIVSRGVVIIAGKSPTIHSQGEHARRFLRLANPQCAFLDAAGGELCPDRVDEIGRKFSGSNSGGQWAFGVQFYRGAPNEWPEQVGRSSAKHMALNVGRKWFESSYL